MRASAEARRDVAEEKVSEVDCLAHGAERGFNSDILAFSVIILPLAGICLE